MFFLHKAASKTDFGGQTEANTISWKEGGTLSSFIYGRIGPENKVLSESSMGLSSFGVLYLSEYEKAKILTSDSFFAINRFKSSAVLEDI